MKIPPFKKIRLRALAVAPLSNLTTTTQGVHLEIHKPLNTPRLKE